MTQAACGVWTSPVDAASLIQGATGLGELRATAQALYWLESRPTEGGRTTLMRRDLARIRHR